MVLLVDARIETLPLEALSVFDKVSAVARDFNLHLHMHRLNAVGHKAELHNNLGLARDDLHYIVDVPETEALRKRATEFVQKEMPALMPGSTWDGVLTH